MIADVAQRMRKLQRIAGRAFRECRPGGAGSIAYSPLVARAAWLLEQGNHTALTAASSRLLQFEPQGLGTLYRAHSLFLTGRYGECRELVAAFLGKNPYHADACYLLAQVSTVDGHSSQALEEVAWQALEKLAANSRRLKTWLVMANMVKDVGGFRRLTTAWQKARDAGRAPAFHVDVIHYLSVGALRAGEFEFARAIWRQSVMNGAVQMVAAPKYLKKPTFSPRLASVALNDVTNALANVGIPSFLVSGTLLGCIREGRVLDHDNDIDIGVWEDAPRQVMLDTLGSCGLFYVQPARSSGAIRLRHVNGTAIDVFYHVREQRDYWHAGVKARWHNSPFTLVKREFLGRKYLIPEDFETYLKENYGNWRMPKTPFDSVYDTPNAEIVNEDEMVVHDYRLFLQGVIYKNEKVIKRYAEKLMERGEEAFIPKNIIQ
jgi:hypothetical protein